MDFLRSAAGYPAPSKEVSTSGSAHQFRKGDVVEYYSVSSGGWISAKVVGLEPGGSYSLDVKAGVPASKIRAPPNANVDLDATVNVGTEGKAAQPSQPPGYAVGEAVEYLSASNGGWVPAKVLAKTARGTYDLDCRYDVSPEKIRRPGGTSPEKSSPPSKMQLSSADTPIPQSQSQLQMSSSNAPQMMPGSAAKIPSLAPPAVLVGSKALDASHAMNVSRSQVPVALDQPIQLLSVQRQGTKWRYEVCAEGAKVLQSHGSRRISVISICGLYRTGKSYILNLLLDRVQKGLPLFQVGSTTRACTEGLWLWATLDSSDKSSPLLAFIDCEGFGSTDSDRTRDAQLMTLCALLSSVLVLNTKGALNESIFNALSLVCRFAEHVEERGNQASRPALLWLLRDFQLDLLDPEGNPISPAEYLERALHAAPLSGHDAERGQAAREVRQSLLKFFSQRWCHTLVRPVIDENDLQRLEKLPFNSLRPEFRTGMESLKLDIVARSHEAPKAVGGQLLTCASFTALLQQLIASMNESQILSVKGAWETVQHSACGSLTDELRQQACQWLRVLTSGQRMEGGVQLPMHDLGLNDLLEDQRKRLKKLWDERAVGDEATRAEYWRELLESLAPEESVTKERNSRLADQQLAQALESWSHWIDDDSCTWPAGEKVIENMSPLMNRVPAAALARATVSSMQAAGKRVTKDRGALAKLGERVTGHEVQGDALAMTRREQAMSGQVHELQAQLNEARRSEQKARLDLEARSAELSNLQGQRQQLVEEAEAVRARELESKRVAAHAEEKGSSLQGELEMAKAHAARADQEKNNLERAVRATRSEFEVAESERRKLEAILQQTREELQAERQKSRGEREALHNEKAQVMQQLNNERRGLAAVQEGQGHARAEIDRLGHELRDVRAQLGHAQQELQAKDSKIHAKDVELQEIQARYGAKAEEAEKLKNHQREQMAQIYREQAEKEKCLRADLEWVKDAAARSESKFLASERAARKARWEADTALEERKWIEQELKKKQTR